jgi:hypothetical protein
MEAFQQMATTDAKVSCSVLAQRELDYRLIKIMPGPKCLAYIEGRALARFPPEFFYLSEIP